MMTEAMTARLKPVQPGRTSLVSVLDIGSTKICCVIARLTPNPRARRSRAGRTWPRSLASATANPRASRAALSPTSIRPSRRSVR